MKKWLSLLYCIRSVNAVHESVPPLYHHYYFYGHAQRVQNSSSQTTGRYIQVARERINYFEQDVFPSEHSLHPQKRLCTQKDYQYLRVSVGTDTDEPGKTLF
jgi:hypothetical protein